jgi:hypothetical protein
MIKRSARRSCRLVFSILLVIAMALLGNTSVEAADWYPNEYYLHGHVDFYGTVIQGSPYMRSTAYSLTSDEFVWIGVYATISDYCSGGAWSGPWSGGWNWIYDWPNTYHDAQTTLAPSQTCGGSHIYCSRGSHNIHTPSGASWPVDFTGDTVSTDQSADCS